jgi:hypothetical protein
MGQYDRRKHVSSSSEHVLCMPPQFIPAQLDQLRGAFNRGRLTLYLGAGLSLASGLPTWNTLVATLYYSAVSADWGGKWRPFPNYLFALGEWLLKQSGEPPEVIAGKVESYYGQQNGGQRDRFEQQFLKILYSPWEQGGNIHVPSVQDLRAGNELLNAAALLCEATTEGRGLYSVVTTNYDCLLEKALEGGPAEGRFVPVWRSLMAPTGEGRAGSAKKGIYHVHGYLPPPSESPGSPFNEILLTEAHYHAAASELYSWSNLCLIRCFSSSIGLIAGMSMTDRNLRRLLHALKHTELLEPVYLMLKRPHPPVVSDCDATAIHENAKQYANRFSDSRLKRDTAVAEKLDTMLVELTAQEEKIAERSLRDLGVTVVWVEDYADIPVLIESITGGDSRGHIDKWRVCQPDRQENHMPITP